MLRTTKIALTVSAAICASLVASTVQAAVVQYQATLKFGFGEKNNYTTPATTVTPATATLSQPSLLVGVAYLAVAHAGSQASGLLGNVHTHRVVRWNGPRACAGVVAALFGV